MSFLRNVFHDLVEKRLWPVAAALVLALVAIPVVLGGSSDAEPAPVAPTPSNGALGARDVARAEVVSLEEQALAGRGKVSRKGASQNPFEQHHVPKASSPVLQGGPEAIVDATKELVSGGTAGGGTGGSDTPSTGGDTGGDKEPAAKKKPAPKPAQDDLYKVKVAFGEAGEEKTWADLARLTPLPSSTDAFLVFLGIKSDGETAVFLVSSDAVLSGDGTCRPREDSCETLELKAGDTHFLDLQGGTAGVVQYQIEVKSIKKVKASSKATAAAAHKRESKAGREALRATLANDPGILDGWHFSADLGILVERTDESREADVAHVPAGVADAAAGDTSLTVTPEFSPGTP